MSQTPRPAPEPIVPEEALVIGEVIDDATESEIARIGDETGARKTSAEMVAEARERFGKRPG